MTEIPEHLRRRAEDARQAAGKAYTRTRGSARVEAVESLEQRVTKLENQMANLMDPLNPQYRQSGETVLEDPDHDRGNPRAFIVILVALIVVLVGVLYALAVALDV